MQLIKRHLFLFLAAAEDERSCKDYYISIEKRGKQENKYTSLPRSLVATQDLLRAAAGRFHEREKVLLGPPEGRGRLLLLLLLGVAGRRGRRPGRGQGASEGGRPAHGLLVQGHRHEEGEDRLLLLLLPEIVDRDDVRFWMLN